MQHEMHPKPQSKPNYLTSSVIKWHATPLTPSFYRYRHRRRLGRPWKSRGPSGSKPLELISGSLNFLRSHWEHQQGGWRHHKMRSSGATKRRCYADASKGGCGNRSNQVKFQQLLLDLNPLKVTFLTLLAPSVLETEGWMATCSESGGIRTELTLGH